MGDMEKSEAMSCRHDAILQGREDLVQFFKLEGVKCRYCGIVDHTLTELLDEKGMICEGCDNQTKLPPNCSAEEAIDLALAEAEGSVRSGRLIVNYDQAIKSLARMMRVWKAQG